MLDKMGSREIGMCYSDTYYSALNWLSLKTHNSWCVESQKKFSYWCSTCADHKKLGYKRPQLVDADNFGTIVKKRRGRQCKLSK